MGNFTSVFSNKMDAMLDYRTASGFKRDSYLFAFKKFDSFCNEQLCTESELTAPLVYGWLEKEAERDITAKATAIRQFGKYLRAIGETAFVLPERETPAMQKSTPYIFTDDELTELFSAIDNLISPKNEPFLSEIAPVMFRLTYTCGLRPNESRELLRSNVNLDRGEILITNTKRNKERIVLMSDDMCALCRKFDLRRSILAGTNPYFFPSVCGGALTNATVYSAFNKAWKTCSRKFGNILPKSVRVYDLRHRFASACLNRWLDEGEIPVRSLSPETHPQLATSPCIYQ